MSTFAVSKNVLLWALERAGQSVADAAQAFPKFDEWLQGRKQPSLRQLEEFARLTRIPLGYLFLPSPIEEKLPIPHFRTVRSDPRKFSPELLDTIHAMQIRQDWMRDEAIENGQARISFIRSATVGELAEVVAARMRSELRFDADWAAHHRTWTDALRALREAMEAAGVLVVANGVVGNNTHRKLDVEEFRGFVLVDDYAPLVFVNNADAKAAQMFTLAHELAHLFFGASAVFDLRQMAPADDRTERACNQAAAEFLVPAAKLVQFWPTVRDEEEPFQSLARRFKVSEIVAARRALDAGLIDQDQFWSFYREYRAAERQRAEEATAGGDFYANQMVRVGSRFGAAVVRAVREGRLPYTEAYRMTGLYGNTFEQFAASLVSREA